jgi:hypothetical protein
MTLALTCACGARLEIDEKFAGQTIECPDCNRPLETAPAAKPPKTSGLALASLLLALIGAFTLVGTLLAIACGLMGLKQIRRAPEQIGGARYARAGIVLGGIFTVLTLGLLWSRDFLKLDSLLRTIESAGSVVYGHDDLFNIQSFETGVVAPTGTIRRPSSAWGQWTTKDPNNEKTDDLVLVNLWEDAYITCLSHALEQQANLSPEDCRRESVERLLRSDLFTKILRGITTPMDPAPGRDQENKPLGGRNGQEFILDSRLRGVDWTFIIRVAQDGSRLNIVAGGTRKVRFARLRPEFDKALDSYQTVK